MTKSGNLKLLGADAYAAYSILYNSRAYENKVDAKFED